MLTHTILHCLCCRGPAGTVTCYLCKEEINLELWLRQGLRSISRYLLDEEAFFVQKVH